MTNTTAHNKALGVIDRISVFSFHVLGFFLPISIALCETFCGMVIFMYLLKRSILFIRGFLVSWAGPSVLQKTLNISRHFLSSYRPVSNPLNWPIFSFILINFLSIFVSQHPVLSWKGFFFKVLEWTFLYFAFLEFMTKRRHLISFLCTFLAGAVLVCINGLVQHTTGEGFIFHHKTVEGRVASSLRHPNDFGAYLMFPVFLAYTVFVEMIGMIGKKRTGGQKKNTSLLDGKRMFTAALFFILMGLFVVNIGLTLSRITWIGLFFGCVFLFFFKRAFVVWGTLLIVVFLQLFNPLLKDMRNVTMISDDFKTFEHIMEKKKEELMDQEPQNVYTDKDTAGQPPAFVNAEESIKQTWQGVRTYASVVLNMTKNFKAMGRKGFWREAVHIIRDHPVLGTGVNTYSQVGRTYKIGWGGYPHNCYLQMAAEIGLLGLVSFLWIIVAFFGYANRKLRQIQEGITSSAVAGLLAGIFGFLVIAAGDTSLYSVNLGNGLWVFMGAVTAIIQQASASQPTKQTGVKTS